MHGMTGPRAMCLLRANERCKSRGKDGKCGSDTSVFAIPRPVAKAVKSVNRMCHFSPGTDRRESVRLCEAKTIQRSMWNGDCII